MYYPAINREFLRENLHIYIFLLVLLIFVGIFVYIKLRYPFWNLQPVYHTYDFWRPLWREPYFIYKKAISTKFVDLISIKTTQYEDITEDQKKSAINLLQCYYLPSENTNFMFHLENLDTYLHSHLSPSYISLFYSSVLQDPLGCISCRSGSLKIGQWTTPIYYVDFIAMHRDAPILYWRKLLQTHIYRQQLETPEIMGSLIKKEGEPYDGVVPFIQTISSLYDIPKLIYEKKQAIALPEHFIIVDFHKVNIDILFDFLEGSQNKFAAFCQTDKPSILRMIEGKILFIYGIKRIDDIYAIYIFRDMRTLTEEWGPPKGLLQLVGSISNTSSTDLFYRGFQLSLRSVIKKMPVFGLLIIEDIAHNMILYDRIGGLSMAVTPVSYYLYNIVSPVSPFLGSQTFVLF